LTKLEEVVARLIDGYEPERIILFGSSATRGVREGSDIDLLIVKNTPARHIERHMEVERLLADRRVPLDLLVYTPREVWDLYAAGSPFIEEVLETGRVLYMRKATAAWLADAHEEWEAASILVEHRKYRAVCFHCQQSVEKTLKALILERGNRPSHTHDIVELLNAATADGWAVGLAMDEAVFLNSIYRARYPTERGLLPLGEPGEADARRALVAAGTVLDHAGRALG